MAGFIFKGLFRVQNYPRHPFQSLFRIRGIWVPVRKYYDSLHCLLVRTQHIQQVCLLTFLLSYAFVKWERRPESLKLQLKLHCQFDQEEKDRKEVGGPICACFGGCNYRPTINYVPHVFHFKLWQWWSQRQHLIFRCEYVESIFLIEASSKIYGEVLVV